MSVVLSRVFAMSNQSHEPRGCLAFLFGFGGSRTAGNVGVADPSAGEEGNYHSGPGGYEGGSYSGGYAADYRAEQAYFDESEDSEDGEH
jgi:hypothetical protein